MLLSQVEFLKHILLECNYLINEVNDNTIEDLISNERLNRAVCRSLEIIGEASSKIHPDLKQKYPSIPWRELTDIRNKIIHHYFGVDYDIIWDTITNDIPSLKIAIAAILKENS